TCSARIVQPDDGRTGLHRQIHYLTDLFGVRFRKRTAKDREVLCEYEHLAAIDEPMSCDNAVARKLLFIQSKIGRSMRDKFVELLERSSVQKEFDPFARGHAAAALLLFYTVSTAAGFRRGGTFPKFGEFVCHFRFGIHKA